MPVACGVIACDVDLYPLSCNQRQNNDLFNIHYKRRLLNTYIVSLHNPTFKPCTHVAYNLLANDLRLDI